VTTRGAGRQAERPAGRGAGPIAGSAGPPKGPAAGGTPPAGAGSANRGRGPSYLKGGIVLAVAVGLGAYLLQLGAPKVGGTSAAANSPAGSTSLTGSGGSTSTTTTAPPASSTTTTAANAPSKTVKVLVANASQTNGVAAYYSGQLSSDGWGTLTPITALTARVTSNVYYASGDRGFASTVASELGLAPTAVQPYGGSTAVRSTTGVQIVVIVGNDLAAKAHPAG